jgi:DNA primase
MEFVEQLKSSVDIVTVIGEYVRLKKVGTRYTGLCPFHNEKTPSFSVNPQHQFFKCFGCGEGGDLIGFVMKYESLSFYEAIKSLSERFGIPMPKRTAFSDDDTKARAAIYRIHEIAEAEFRRQLNSDAGRQARGYLEKRGVTPDAAAAFAIGYAPPGVITRVLQRENFTPQEMEDSGLLLKREDGSFYERFRNRLIFPIHNESGKPIAFGGRALDPEDQPKYLNSPETKIYRKSSVLYNLHRAKDAVRTQDRIVLVEGYMDVIGVYTAGIREVIASCGTALTAQQVQSIRRHSHNIVVNFDPDAAGAKAAERGIQLLLAESMHVRVVSLEDGLDPDEYCRKHGAEAYARHIQQSSGYFHWLAARARERFDMRSAEGRYQAFQFLLPAIQSLTDKLERVAVVNDVAGYLGVDAGLVLESFRKLAADKSAVRAQPKPEPMRPTDRILLSAIFSSPDIHNDLFEYLSVLPSLRQGPIAGIYDAMVALHQNGAPVDYHAVHARLDEPTQELLAAAILRDECEPATPEQAMACLEALVEEERGRERSAMKARVKEAERAGNVQEAMRLYQELERLTIRN